MNTITANTSCMIIDADLNMMSFNSIDELAAHIGTDASEILDVLLSGVNLPFAWHVKSIIAEGTDGIAHQVVLVSTGETQHLTIRTI